MLIKGTITKKVYMHLFGVALIAAGAVYILSSYLDIQTYAWEQVIYMIGGALLVLIILYYSDVVRPLSLILTQIKAVLTGRRYSKIYTKRSDEMGIIAHFFNEVTSSLEKVTDELEQSKKVTGELRTAGQLQKELIPDEPPTINGFDIAIKNRSAEELGGDNLDFIKVGTKTYFYIGDVTGHGVPAAIVMTMVNTLINAFAELYDTAYDIVVQTNRRLKKRIRATMFMSMLMLRWDDATKKMSYVGCGHEHIIIYRAATGKVDCEPSGGIALGMVADNSKIVKEKTLDLNKGDVLVMYTDGITEAKNMSGELFGLERLKETIGLHAGQDEAVSIIQDIAKDFSRYVEDHVQEDDVTLIVIKKLDEGQQGKASIDQRQARWADELAQESMDTKEKNISEESVGKNLLD